MTEKHQRQLGSSKRQRRKRLKGWWLAVPALLLLQPSLLKELIWPPFEEKTDETR